MNIAICDDDSKDIKELSSFLYAYASHMRQSIGIDVYTDPMQLLASEKTYKILIMDIVFPTCNGMEIVKAFHEKHKDTVILYYSSNLHIAYQTYDAYGKGFIKKPIDKENFFNELSRIMKGLHVGMIEVPLYSDIKISVAMQDICYIRTYKRGTILYFDHKQLECQRSVSEWQQLLNVAIFSLCRRGWLVNLGKIQSIDSFHMIHMRNNDTLSISERKYKEFINKYIVFKRDFS